MPIDIPPSQPVTTRVARALYEACQVLTVSEGRLDEVLHTVKRSPPRTSIFHPSALKGSSQLLMTDKELHENITEAGKMLQELNEKKKKATQAEMAPLDARIQAVTQRLNDLKQASSDLRLDAAEAVSALRAVCKAVEDGKFTAEILKSIRNFASEPDRSVAALGREIAPDKSLLDLLPVEAGEPRSVFGGVASLTSGSLEAYLVAGLANFVYSRAKAEALQYLTRRLGKILCAETVKINGKEESPGPGAFLKNVCVAFADLDSSMKLSAIGSYLAAAARKDVARLPDVILVHALSALTKGGGCDKKDNKKDNEKDNKKDNKEDNSTPCEALTGARIALAFYYEIARGRPALDVARSLHQSSFINSQENQAPKAIPALKVASQILDAVMRQEGWHEQKEWRDKLPYFAIGTLLELEDVRSGWKMDTVLVNTDIQRIFALRALVKVVLQIAVETHERVEHAIKLMQRPSGTDNETQADAEARRSMAKAELARAASSALMAMIKLQLDELKLDPAALKRIEKLVHLGELIASGEATPSVALELTDLLVTAVDNSSLPAKVQDSAVFKAVKTALPIATQLARAQSADEVTKILEAAAAPVGGYRLKSQGSLVSLTAFAGAAIGRERVAGHGWGNPAGVFAPVGIHLTRADKPADGGKPGNASDDERGSWGMMLSILNLGNLVSERLDDDLDKSAGSTMTEVSSSASESLRAVFSPGVFVTRSIAGPFVIGGGVQFVPSARDLKITTTTMDADMVPVTTTATESRGALQALVFLGVDVTIFPF